MTEREMEDLIWEYPEKFLNEPLRQFERQPASSVGRADLVFLDRLNRILIIELKRGTLQRGAVPQIIDYLGMLKDRFPDSAVELMVVANSIPPERRLTCEQYHVEPVEIPQKKFRDVAEEVGYVFRSETASHEASSVVVIARSSTLSTSKVTKQDDFRREPFKIEKSWYFWRGIDKDGYFLAFVNARGSCSMRRFDASTGRHLMREPNKPGDYQEGFSEYLRSGLALSVSRQPNLERDCRDRLPESVFSELRRQVPEDWQ